MFCLMGLNLAKASIDLLRWPADANPSITTFCWLCLGTLSIRYRKNCFGGVVDKVNSYEPFLFSFFFFSEVGSLPQVFYWQLDINNWDCKKTSTCSFRSFCAFLVLAGFLKRWGNVSVEACILQLELKHLY